jgi:hypothetical protein
MADISDLEQAIADTVTAILYPLGPSGSSVVGALCRIYRGWPNSATLNTDLNAGAVNVTICADNDSGRTTTRYLPRWQTTSVQPGVTAVAEGPTLSISGGPVVGDVVGVIVDEIPFSYRIQAGDSPDLIAANLGQSIQGTRLVTLQGATITIPGARSIVARTVCDSSASFESRRQEKDLRIICWCPNPSVRDAVASTVDAAIDQLAFLTLADGTQARIAYHNTASYDQAQNALLYRRDLIYSAEYATVAVIQQPSMLFGESDLNTNITYG